MIECELVYDSTWRFEMIFTRYNKVQHVCYLMDGDRTFAIMEGVPDSDIEHHAYHSGALALENLMKMTFDELKIKCLSVNLIGRRNCIKRKESAEEIVSLIPKFFGKKWIDYFLENKIHVKFLGDLELFCNMAEDPKAIMSEIKRVEDLTSKFENFYLTLMSAYEPTFEYLKLSKSGGLTSLEDAKKNYYGFDIPNVDFIIRAWRPKLSGCVPIMVSDYSDIYLFPSPFQCFKLEHFKMILEDYAGRSDNVLKYGAPEIKTIREYSDRLKNNKPVIIGKKIGNIWLPME